jgi:cytochrome P450
MSSDRPTDELPRLDWRSPAYEQAPLACLKALAEAGPVARTELGYAVLAREEARPVLRADLPISVYHIPEAISPYLAERTKQPLLLRHGPEHTQLRAMLTRVLRTRVIETLRPQIRAIFASLLEPLLARGEGDLVAELFHPYPAQVLAPMLGIPMADIDRVSGWVTSSARWTNILNPPETLAAIETAWRALEGYLLDLFQTRRLALGTDVFSELIREMEGHDELEIVGIAMEMTRAGMDTTRRQLACTMHALVENPAEWRRLVDDPGLVSHAVEEGMRYAPITHAVSRQTLTDSEMAGVAAKAGTVFTVMPMVVNRDPAVFPEPDRFDAARSPCPHMTFGFGSHACVGSSLARMEMTEAFSLLAERVDGFELLEDVPRSHVSTGWVPTRLPVRLRVRPGTP